MSFSAAIYDAIRAPHSDDARSSVHELVGQELRKLDPGVNITPTDYFNHSFVPDFVLSWGGGEEAQRDLFLRLTVSSAAFGEDLDLLADREALFLGVFDEKPLDDAAWVDEQSAAMSSLVTQALAVDAFENERERDARTSDATREIVRSGKGAIDVPGAEEIGSSYRNALSVIDTLSDVPSDDHAVSVVSTALSTLRPVLKESGAIQLEQVLQALWIRHGGSPSHFPGIQGWNPRDLSPDALRAVLLDLINSGAMGIDQETWGELAGHLSAEDVGRFLSQHLYDGGFDRLASALSPGWTAKWVWVDDERPPSLLTEPFAWLVDDEVLGLDTGRIRMFFADDGRHFMYKPSDLELPTLRDVSGYLASPDVQGAALRSSTDDVELILREGAGDRSVQEIANSLLADPEATGHRVRSLMVKIPGTDRSARVNYGDRKIDLDGSTDIRTAAIMAYRYLGEPAQATPDVSRLEAFLRFDEGADGPGQGGPQQPEPDRG